MKGHACNVKLILFDREELVVLAETNHIKMYVLSKVGLPIKKDYKLAAAALCEFVVGAKTRLGSTLYFKT